MAIRFFVDSVAVTEGKPNPDGYIWLDSTQDTETDLTLNFQYKCLDPLEPSMVKAARIVWVPINRARPDSELVPAEADRVLAAEGLETAKLKLTIPKSRIQPGAEWLFDVYAVADDRWSKKRLTIKAM